VFFLIEYDRRSGRSVSIQTYQDSDRNEADRARLELELDLNRRGVAHEVVLLEAENEAALRQTHGRYFYDLEEIIDHFVRAPLTPVVRETKD
jgi:hypothetical protein